jgi:hypothetical protein
LSKNLGCSLRAELSFPESAKDKTRDLIRMLKEEKRK